MDSLLMGVKLLDVRAQGFLEWVGSWCAQVYQEEKISGEGRFGWAGKIRRGGGVDMRNDSGNLLSNRAIVNMPTGSNSIGQE